MTIPAVRPYTIDPPMPVPARKHYTGKYPYKLLKVGESFLADSEAAAMYATRGARIWAAREKNGRTFVMRRVDNGWRVWRTA